MSRDAQPCVSTDKGIYNMTNQTDWHRLFGITLVDYFTSSNYRVELEKDLSIQQQFLDVIIIEKAQGQVLDELPDGFDNLRKYNLLTYKSHHEPLNPWTLDELVGHYADYRKQESLPKKNNKKTLLPERDFQLYAVCTRYPQKMAKKYTLLKIQEGVYELPWGSKLVRVIVLSQISQTQKNTMWQLFSSVFSKFDFAKSHHHWRNPELSSVINQLYEHYRVEGVFMSYTIEDYLRENKQHVLNSSSLEEILKGRSPEDVVKALPMQEVVKALPTQELVKALPLEVIEEYLNKLKQKQ